MWKLSVLLLCSSAFILFFYPVVLDLRQNLKVPYWFTTAVYKIQNFYLQDSTRYANQPLEKKMVDLQIILSNQTHSSLS